MNKNAKLPETEDGTVLFNVDPIIIKDHYEIDYIHSYAQDSPFFAGLAQKKLLGSSCTGCGYRYATPRGHCMECGATTEIYTYRDTLSLHDALPISPCSFRMRGGGLFTAMRGRGRILRCRYWREREKRHLAGICRIDRMKPIDETPSMQRR